MYGENRCEGDRNKAQNQGELEAEKTASSPKSSLMCQSCSAGYGTAMNYFKKGGKGMMQEAILIEEFSRT